MLIGNYKFFIKKKYEIIRGLKCGRKVVNFIVLFIFSCYFKFYNYIYDMIR